MTVVRGASATAAAISLPRLSGGMVGVSGKRCMVVDSYRNALPTATKSASGSVYCMTRMSPTATTSGVVIHGTEDVV